MHIAASGSFVSDTLHSLSRRYFLDFGTFVGYFLSLFYSADIIIGNNYLQPVYLNIAILIYPDNLSISSVYSTQRFKYIKVSKINKKPTTFRIVHHIYMILQYWTTLAVTRMVFDFESIIVYWFHPNNSAQIHTRVSRRKETMYK